MIKLFVTLVAMVVLPIVVYVYVIEDTVNFAIKGEVENYHQKLAQGTLSLLNKRVAGLDEHSRGQVVDSCLLYTSPSPRDLSTSRMPSSA